MPYMRSVSLLLLVNLCIILCASLPFSSIQREEKDNLYNKVFPGEEGVFQDYFDRYPWRRNEQTGSIPSRDRTYNNEDTASKIQLQQSLTDGELKRTLIRDILNWEARKKENLLQNGDTFEKREPQKRKCRVSPGFMGCRRKQTQKDDEAKSKDRDPFIRDLGARLNDEQDADRIKQYDAEIDRTLRELELEMHGRKLM